MPAERMRWPVAPAVNPSIRSVGGQTVLERLLQ
jgi:hypothetical protein